MLGMSDDLNQIDTHSECLLIDLNNNLIVQKVMFLETQGFLNDSKVVTVHRNYMYVQKTVQ